MTKEIVVLGSGGHAKVVLDLINKLSSASVAGVYDDYAPVNKKVLQYSVLGDKLALVEKAHTLSDAGFVVAIGNNEVRCSQYDYLIEQGLHGQTVIHPTAILADDIEVGNGSMLIANTVINPGSRIGNNVIINTSAVIDHDCIVADHVHISPNATLCGGVSIGEKTWIGAGATVIEGVKVGDNCIIGAGSTVITNVPDNSVFGGVPAKSLRKL